ncbi:nucleoside diphosphate-linked moiety X motif 13 isoform X1 [Solea solea]|uniref:nucleoside diphosphate-linked moiety X motif 13 isoform X1 n=1 Tax=Solea solea TaxID=90069 RepID=UPI0027297D74|nr:nucleoside diphosphate-linked moiety X motif 13 isoform X1 [Solea solea]XP_058477741.1 nucleoside diphosphate-linked moiety X motif 13 isoform X1 [Solea solea]XP_058477742.1 nucleoside diphosphate-linked moiety X motif 13 isoform X1 [Solea solea]XP_058477743.1 nucleoside diphosphate-linked moiety X motif 13 isoform X1 [Solea solea]XP_058477745.1 nucleoside diphosphate-linked moiety X motif 13 isoform X1 [Solea solea]XP_058477748.1 nucleoside diphosphate-linked moiety X motif 13 isoform X1 [
MLSSLRILLPVIGPLSRGCSGYVSRMRFVNRLKQDDAACLAALQRSRVLLFHRLCPLLQRTERGTLRTAAFNSSDVQLILERLGADRSLLKESVLIGCSEQNQAQFCLDLGELDQAAVEGECDANFFDLRKSFFLLTGAEVPLVTKSQALLRWHQSSGFCSATGEPTQRNQAGSHRVGGSRGIVYYPTMSPVVIVLVSDGKRCLLARQSSFPQGMYSALAGFCDMGESLEETLYREVAEEVGLEVQNVSYSSSQHWPFPHSSFMLACHAFVSPTHTQVDVDHAELEDARWFSLEEITCALQVKSPPRRGDPLVFWLPPKHAIANRLVTEWVETQRHRESGG